MLKKRSRPTTPASSGVGIVADRPAPQEILPFVPEPVASALVAAIPAAVQEAAEAGGPPATAEQVIDTAIAQAKKRANTLLNRIVNTPEFRRLEQTLGSTERLALDPDASGIDVALINQPFSAIKDDLDDAGATKQNSQLFKEVVDNGYLTPGAQPTTAVAFSDPMGLGDLNALAEIGGIFETGHVVGFGQAKPELLIPDGTSFTQIPKPNVLKGDAAEDKRLTKVRDLRQDSRSRRIVLGGPMYRARELYHPQKNPAKGAEFFQEEATADVGPWTSLTRVVLHCAAASLTRYKVASQIAGEFSGGAFSVTNDIDEYGRQRQVLQVACGDRLEKAISDVGFLIAEPYLNQGKLVIFSARSMFNAPPKSLDAGVSYRMINDQIAKDLKRLLRAAIGLKLTAQKVKGLIEAYIKARYCSANSISAASFDELARHPLKSVEATVTEPQPGVFAASVDLIPHVAAVQFYVATQLTVSSNDD